MPKRFGVAPDVLLLAAAGLAPKRPPPPGVDPVCCEVAVDDGKRLLGAVVVVAGVAEAVVVLADPAPKRFPVAGAAVALLPEPDVPEVVITAPNRGFAVLLLAPESMLPPAEGKLNPPDELC